ncbi:MAG TPA: hypothetical protein VFG05_09860 [Methylocella sp.]|nr:hypothetical protein [Methylocella sp.]
MAKPSTPPKRAKFSTLDILIVIVGVIAIIGYNRITISRLQRSIPNANEQIVGEWTSTRGPEHLVFRQDKSVSLIVEPSASEAKAAEGPGPAPVTGTYQLAQAGKIYIQLMNGKKYTTTISPMNRNRFDLIDSDTDGVTTYTRLAAAMPPAAAPASPAAQESTPAPPAQEAAPLPEEAPPAPNGEP